MRVTLDSIGTKIIVPFLIVSFMTLIVGVVGYIGVRSAVDSLETVATVHMPAVPELLTIGAALRETMAAQRSLLIPAISKGFAQEQHEALRQADRKIKQSLALYEARPKSPEEENLFKEYSIAQAECDRAILDLERKISEWEKDKEDLLSTMEVLASSMDLRPIYARVFASLDRLVGRVVSASSELSSLEKSSAALDERIILAGMIVGPLLALGLGVAVTLLVVKPLERTARFAAHVSAGKLDQPLDVHGRDEFGQLADALRVMVDSLKRLVREAETERRIAASETEKANEAVRQAEEARRQSAAATAKGVMQAAGELQGVVEILTSASEELSAQIDQTNAGAQSQTRSVDHTVVIMEDMAATIAKVAGSAQNAAVTADTALTRAREGSAVVSDVVRGIQRVQAEALGLKEDMSVLGRQVEDIGRIMDVISDIADQTNLLALNAAIEAARAGESGRGFAVVADEVRKLAEKTMTGTREVGAAIQAIQAGTRKNMDNVDKAVVAIETSTSQANESGALLQDIVGLIGDASRQVQAIAEASDQEAEESLEVSQAVEAVRAISSETAESMSQAGQAILELSRQAHVLQRLVADMQSRGGQAG